MTESTAYVRFSTDQIARKNYLQDIANEVVKKMTGPIESPRELLDALGKAVSERRIAVWSSSPADQKLLEETPLAHEIPDDPAPYAEVVINNLGGNKLDYYLKSKIEYAADGCDGEKRMSTVTVRLTNTLQDLRSSAGLHGGSKRPTSRNSSHGAERHHGVLGSTSRDDGCDIGERARQWPTGAGLPRHGTWSPELRSAGSHTARAKRRIELSPLRTDVSGCTARSNSAIARRTSLP